MTLNRGHNFISIYDGVTYNFVVKDSVIPVRDNQTFNYSNVNLVQGQYVTDQYIFDTQIKNSKFVLSNARVDKSSIEVSVTSSGTTQKYSLSTDVSTITSSSRVFYAQENEDSSKFTLVMMFLVRV